MAYCGDDFTGSTDALEALSRSGVQTVLFVEPPTAALLDKYSQARAIGIAGNSRTMSPDEMDAHLPSAFDALLARNPKALHYKVCSTFDSSSQIGSIGRAIEIGQQTCGNRFTPLVVGAPVLQRFCVFGNLFARSGLDSEVFRLDRHPTMRHHPITPMTESDLRIHLTRQTDRPIGLVDLLALEGGYATARQRLVEATMQDAAIVLFDTVTDDHLATIGQLLWESADEEHRPLFIAGSSGVEYALVAHWRSIGLAGDHSTTPYAAPANPVDRALVVSGSCSPVTERQIAWALEHGWAEAPLDTVELLESEHVERDLAEAVAQTKSALDAGRSVIAHTCRGPTDRRILTCRRTPKVSGTTTTQLGDMLGTLLHDVLHSVSIERVAVAGGDTSGCVARSIGITALEMSAPLAPGAPLCRVDSDDPHIGGIEITFKGGQVGHDDFFGTLLRGRPI